jgi:hypothetical protein
VSARSRHQLERALQQAVDRCLALRTELQQAVERTRAPERGLELRQALRDAEAKQQALRLELRRAGGVA